MVRPISSPVKADNRKPRRLSLEWFVLSLIARPYAPKANRACIFHFSALAVCRAESVPHLALLLTPAPTPVMSCPLLVRGRPGLRSRCHWRASDYFIAAYSDA